MARLAPSNQVHLEAAEGWLGLGNWREANESLDCITANLRAHPKVLKLRYAVCAKAEKWELALEIAQTLSIEKPHNSFGFVYTAYALHQLNRTAEAYDTLQPVADRFPEDVNIRYDLACHACKIGKLKEAMGFLGTGDRPRWPKGYPAESVGRSGAGKALGEY